MTSRCVASRLVCDTCRGHPPLAQLSALSVRAEIFASSRGAKSTYLSLSELQKAAGGSGMVPRVAVAVLPDSACYPDLTNLYGVSQGFDKWTPTLSGTDGADASSFSPVWAGR